MYFTYIYVRVHIYTCILRYKYECLFINIVTRLHMNNRTNIYFSDLEIHDDDSTASGTLSSPDRGEGEGDEEEEDDGIEDDYQPVQKT